MPLMKSGSKKAFSKNVETEMKSGKPQGQSLAIAYDVKKRNSKKPRYAKGGQVDKYKNDSAKYEDRPMPSETDNDSKQVSRNSGKKGPGQDAWTDNPTVIQAQRPSPATLKSPKPLKMSRMVEPGGPFNVRNRDMHDDEASMMNRMPPETDRAQPPKRDDEDRADSYGNRVSDMAKQHNNGRMPYNQAIEDQYADDIAMANMKKTQSYAAGGMVASGSRDMDYADGGDVRSGKQRSDYERGVHAESNKGQSEAGEAMRISGSNPNISNPTKRGLRNAAVEEHSRKLEELRSMPKPKLAEGGPVMEPEDDTIELGERSDEAALMDMLGPSMDEGEEDAMSRNESDPMGHNSGPDMEREHNNGRKPYAEGGGIDSDEQPQPEADDEHEDSLIASIMSKRRKYARGGEIMSEDSMDSDDSSQADLSRNTQEDANMEDKSSFDALRKENYSDSYMDRNQPMDSNEHGDDIDSDDHDMVETIRRKYAMKRAFR